jgi:hypothetical protein
MKTGCRQHRHERRFPQRGSSLRASGNTLIIAACWLLLCGPAGSLVGDVPVAERMLARHAVLVYGKGGMCTGVVLAPQLVLTAAHCVTALGTDAHIAGRPAVNVTDVAVHPQYQREARSATPDLGLLKLLSPLYTAPAVLNTQPVAPGASLFIVGYGLGEKDKKRTAGTLRMAMLTVSRQSEQLLVLTDPGHSGLMMPDAGGKIGVCHGDSGAPAFTVRAGFATIAGIVSASNGCGGITYVVPIAPHLGWIRDTARNWYAAIDSR